jgi:hypothetical protein
MFEITLLTRILESLDRISNSIDSISVTLRETHAQAENSRSLLRDKIDICLKSIEK